MSARRFTVACAEHGEMEYAPRCCGWACTAGRCRTFLPEQDIWYLVTRQGAGAPGPVPIAVSDFCVQRAAEMAGAVQ